MASPKGVARKIPSRRRTPGFGRLRPHRDHLTRYHTRNTKYLDISRHITLRTAPSRANGLSQPAARPHPARGNRQRDDWRRHVTRRAFASKPVCSPSRGSRNPASSRANRWLRNQSNMHHTRGHVPKQPRLREQTGRNIPGRGLPTRPERASDLGGSGEAGTSQMCGGCLGVGGAFSWWWLSWWCFFLVLVVVVLVVLFLGGGGAFSWWCFFLVLVVLFLGGGCLGGAFSWLVVLVVVVLVVVLVVVVLVVVVFCWSFFSFGVSLRRPRRLALSRARSPGGSLLSPACWA